MTETWFFGEYEAVRLENKLVYEIRKIREKNPDAQLHIRMSKTDWRLLSRLDRDRPSGMSRFGIGRWSDITFNIDYGLEKSEVVWEKA